MTLTHIWVLLIIASSRHCPCLLKTTIINNAATCWLFAEPTLHVGHEGLRHQPDAQSAHLSHCALYQTQVSQTNQVSLGQVLSHVRYWVMSCVQSCQILRHEAFCYIFSRVRCYVDKYSVMSDVMWTSIQSTQVLSNDHFLCSVMWIVHHNYVKLKDINCFITRSKP